MAVTSSESADHPSGGPQLCSTVRPLFLAMAGDQDTWTCGQCGCPVDHEFQLCWSCGSSRSGVADPGFEPDNALSPTGFYCHQCGHDLSNLQQRRCPECAHPFDPADIGTFSEQSPEFMRAQVHFLVVSGVLFVLTITLIVLRQLFPRPLADVFDATTVVFVVFVMPILIMIATQSFRKNRRPNDSQEPPSRSAPVRERSAPRTVAKTISPQFERLTILQSVPFELQATILVFQLNDAGIDAWSEGGISSGFRAKAPGNANIIVRACDLSRAHSVLRESLHSVRSTSAWRRTIAWLLLILFLLVVM